MPAAGTASVAHCPAHSAGQHSCGCSSHQPCMQGHGRSSAQAQFIVTHGMNTHAITPASSAPASTLYSSCRPATKLALHSAHLPKQTHTPRPCSTHSEMTCRHTAQVEVQQWSLAKKSRFAATLQPLSSTEPSQVPRHAMAPQHPPRASLEGACLSSGIHRHQHA
jgi:hypothetical protein